MAPLAGDGAPEDRQLSRLPRSGSACQTRCSPSRRGPCTPTFLSPPSSQRWVQRPGLIRPAWQPLNSPAFFFFFFLFRAKWGWVCVTSIAVWQWVVETGSLTPGPAGTSTALQVISELPVSCSSHLGQPRRKPDVPEGPSPSGGCAGPQGSPGGCGHLEAPQDSLSLGATSAS